jgi:ABC-type long-subunit fatty acid transport system fused permease/ATPase subunit
MVFPNAGALGLIWLIATYAIIFGVILIIAGVKLRGLRFRFKGATAKS